MRPERFMFSKSLGRFTRYIDTDGIETTIPPGRTKAAEARTFIEQAGKRKRPVNPGRP